MDKIKNLNDKNGNNEEDDDNDEDDEDYVPDEDDEDEDNFLEKEDEENEEGEEEEENEKGVKNKKSKSEEEKKKSDSEESKLAKKRRADDLWADLCSTDSTEKSSSSSTHVKQASSAVGFKGKSGLKNLVSNLGKKPKMNLIEKSKQDWQSFKQEENLEHELKQHTLSKNRYTDKQAFLARTDLRQFEIEKSIRDQNRLRK